MKSVVLDGYLVNPDGLVWELAEKYPDMTWYDESSPEQIISRIGDAQAVFVNRAALTAETFEKCPEIKYVGVLGTGYNAVDIAAAKAHGVVVTNVAGYSTAAVTQTVFSLLLEIFGSISVRTRYVESGGWTKFKDPNVSAVKMNEISGKTLGIIGLGEIGLSVAKVAAAFGMNVVAYKRTPDRSLENESLRFVSLDELYAVSDVISLHCPLNDSTKNMINAESIAKMKDGAVIINTARGGVIQENDMAAALTSGKLYALGADVLSVEPPAAGNPLVGHPGCVITPHIGWTPAETRARLLKLAAENFYAFLSGTPKNVVNP